MCYCKPEVRTPYCSNCNFKMFEDIQALKQKVTDANNIIAILLVELGKYNPDLAERYRMQTLEPTQLQLFMG